ncbi:MAG: hypothetical protein IJG62_06050 [Synergistaceae bacterium]|nr:hypothetical protein [Synergistaceae bacterium]MBQ3626502.1 hypothetical protein [Synergistaceae bacterium]MBQ4419070.1 hypothetical protein [Synergistaceae bacterium]MBQ6909073.1 hypothetical protein [Synergistaceae bacterium]MBQ9581820.1 hypothetical protein [Synergistaceae bacterium]
MTNSTAEIMNKGIKCLLENLGAIDAEYFISVIIKEKFDYTKWQQEYFDGMPDDVLMTQAIEYDISNPV